MAKANPHMLDELYSFTTCDVLITDLATGIELYSGTIKSHELNKTVSKTPIRAGIGGVVWVELENDTEFTLSIVELREKLDLESLKLSGSLPVDLGTTELTAFPKSYSLEGFNDGVGAGITLDHTPLNNGQVITVYRADKGIPIHPSRVDFINNNLIIDFDNLLDGLETIEGITENTPMTVGSYKYQNDKDGHIINIAAEQVGTNVAVTLKQPLYGSDRKVKMWRQTHFYKCSLGTEFTQSSATEMAEQNTTTTFTILKDPKQENLGFIAYVPVEPKYGISNAPFSAKKK